MKKSLEKFQDLVEVQYNKIITDKLAKEVVKVLEDSDAIQSNIKSKRHRRPWYKGTDISAGSKALVLFLLESKISKDEIFIDYQGGNGVLCLYLNKLGYNTYFHDTDNAEAKHLLSYFGLENKIIHDRSDIFSFNPSITVAIGVGCSLNDEHGDPLTNIESLKYIFLDKKYGGGSSRGGGWCLKTDVSKFSIIKKCSTFTLYKAMNI
tara:strand:- start:156 stop:776 length:621 start_codon:yes stop_codon:yes gene_type:complete